MFLNTLNILTDLKGPKEKYDLTAPAAVIIRNEIQKSYSRILDLCRLVPFSFIHAKFLPAKYWIKIINGLKSETDYGHYVPTTPFVMPTYLISKYR